MLQQLKRTRDRFFGAGQADTSVPVLDGPLKPNHTLENAEVFFEALGLEDMCITADGRLMVSSGVTLLSVDEAGQSQTIACLDEPIQALTTYRDGVVAATGGCLHFFGGQLDGKKYQVAKPPSVGCINSMCEHPDGSIIISEGSVKHTYSEWTKDLLSDGASGRVLQYQPKNDQLEILQHSLKYAYGALVDAQGSIYTSESWGHRIIQISKNNARSVYQDLPGYPSRLIKAQAGGYWLTVFAPRNQLVEFVLREPDFKHEMMATVDPKYWIAPALSSGHDFIEPLQQGGVRQMGVLKPWAPARSYGLVVRLDADFQPLLSLHSRVGGYHHGVTAVVEFHGALLILSKGASKVLRLALSDIK
jgi:hypothetical protein